MKITYQLPKLFNSMAGCFEGRCWVVSFEASTAGRHVIVVQMWELSCACWSIISFNQGLFALVSSAIPSTFVGSGLSQKFTLARDQECNLVIAKNYENLWISCLMVFLCIDPTSLASLFSQVKADKHSGHQFPIFLHLRNAQLLHVGKYIRNHLVIAVDKIFLSYYPL